MRLSLLALTLLTFAAFGCVPATTGPSVGLKEVWVEPYDGSPNPVTEFPFHPLEEGRCYVSLRGLASGKREARRRLALLLDQRPTPTKGETAPISSEVRIDDKDYPQGLPELLFFPTKLEEATESLCFVGHVVYVREVFRPGDNLAHHFRLLLLNREQEPLRIHADSLQLSLAQDEDAAAITGSSFQFLAFANERGERIRELVVPPGEQALAHVFFAVDKFTRHVHLRWAVEELPIPVDGPGAASAKREPLRWPFSARFVRRYVLSEGHVTSLERRVGRGEDLPEPQTRRRFTEPRVAPVGGR